MVSPLGGFVWLLSLGVLCGLSAGRFCAVSRLGGCVWFLSYVGGVVWLFSLLYPSGVGEVKGSELHDSVV